MDHFIRLKNQVRGYLVLALLAVSLLAGASVWLGLAVLDLDGIVVAAAALLIITAAAVITASLLAGYVLEPLKYVWEAVLHVSPQSSHTAAPNLDKARLGRELVASLALQVYQMASQSNDTDDSEHRSEIVQSAQIVRRLPLPLFVFNKQQLVTNASDEGLDYAGISSAELFGKPLNESLDLEFPNEFTLDKWIKNCQANKVTDTAYWDHVRIRPRTGDVKLRQCDMAAYYNRENAAGAEFIVTLFDRTERYTQDDQSLSFVALAVHELRTPLTALRGYIEVFEDEFADKLDEELAGFMKKMRVSADQLTVFVNNILNIARIEENQLALKLHEADWPVILNRVVDDMRLKAQVHDKRLEVNTAEGLPPVAVDHISIYEVLANLIDNAIKYSGDSERIIISSSIGNDGRIETTVQDFGVGIPESVMPNLFEKFYRNHRTKNQVGGTGLGLYLSKSIVKAHGGQIWANSREGEGSVFGFSLLPYSELADEQKSGNGQGIVRTAHGWIKNHSLYRR